MRYKEQLDEALVRQHVVFEQFTYHAQADPTCVRLQSCLLTSVYEHVCVVVCLCKRGVAKLGLCVCVRELVLVRL